MFKYVKGFDRIQFVNPPKFLTNHTRGHVYKFEGDKLVMKGETHPGREFYFLNRVESTWNSLSAEVLEATSVNDFKNKIDKMDMFQFGH